MGGAQPPEYGGVGEVVVHELAEAHHQQAAPLVRVVQVPGGFVIALWPLLVCVQTNPWQEGLQICGFIKLFS